MDKTTPVKISTKPTVPTGRTITVIDVIKEYVIDKEEMNEEWRQGRRFH